jgi:hypothetical protein
VQRIDISDQIVNLGPCQCKVGHRTMRMRKERTKLVCGHAAAGDRVKARRALWHRTGGAAVDHVTAGAPLPGELATSRGISTGRGRSSRAEQKDHQQKADHSKGHDLPAGGAKEAGLSSALLALETSKAALPPR